MKQRSATRAQRAGSVGTGGQALEELLVRRGMIDAGRLDEARAQQWDGKPLGVVLVDLGILEEGDLVVALAEGLGLRLVDLHEAKPTPEAVTCLAEATARALTAVPIRVVDDGLEVAVADPDPEVQQRLARESGRSVHLVVAPVSDIRRAIDSNYRVLIAVDQHVAAFERAESGRRTSQRAAEAPSDTAPVSQVVQLLITQGFHDRASDIHIEPQDERIRVRARIDGALHDMLSLPAAMGPALVSRIKIMANMNIVERRRPQDGQIATEIDGHALDIRVATTATIWGEKAVLRLLDKTRPLYRMADLGMPADTNATFSKLVRSPFGMVICAGPTGSGKTTTLYATLREINDSERNIMTIEDPVEYVFPSINQIQMNEQAGVTFADGLKSILRQDPDVILVGEIRDVETARIAFQSALTGHFVLSSLHATDAPAALHRFLDMGIESFLVASSIVGVVGQRLLRRMCTFCKEPYDPTDEEMAFYEEAEGTAKRTFWHGKGCNFCSDTGYQDRIGIFELLQVTPEMKRLIVGWATQEELQRLAVQQGMRTLREEAISLVRQDVTTISEVIRNLYTF